MKSESMAAVVVALSGTVLLVVLLAKALISATHFAALIVCLAAVCLIVFGFRRVSEFSLSVKECKVLFHKVEQVKAELDEMYSGIHHLKRYPLTLDKEKMKELGLEGGFALSAAVMRYTAGALKRERERLARIFVKQRPAEEIAKAILDGSLDELVFKWSGPEAPLDAPPKSVAAREAEKEGTS